MHLKHGKKINLELKLILSLFIEIKSQKAESES